MTEHRDPNNVPLNEDLQNLPDRKSAERNSVYNAAGGDTNDPALQNLPDHQIAERNSVYKLANKKRDAQGLAIDSNMPDSQQDFGDSTYSSSPGNTSNRNFGDSLHNSNQSGGVPTGQQYYNDPAYSGSQGNIPSANNTSSQSRYGAERGSQMPAGSGYAPNSAGMDKDVDVVSEHHGPGFSTRHGNDAANQLGYNQTVEQGWGDKENQLPETVSLNEQGYQGPSKLDALEPNANLTQQNQVGFRGSLIDQDRPKDYTTQSETFPTFGTDSQVSSDTNSDPGYRPA